MAAVETYRSRVVNGKLTQALHVASWCASGATSFGQGPQVGLSTCFSDGMLPETFGDRAHAKGDVALGVDTTRGVKLPTVINQRLSNLSRHAVMSAEVSFITIMNITSMEILKEVRPLGADESDSGEGRMLADRQRINAVRFVHKVEGGLGGSGGP